MKSTSTENTAWLDSIYMKPEDYEIYGRTSVECKIIKFRIVE